MSQLYAQSVRCQDCNSEIDVSDHKSGRYPKRCQVCIDKNEQARWQKWYDNGGKLKLYLKRNKQQMKITFWMEIRN